MQCGDKRVLRETAGERGKRRNVALATVNVLLRDRRMWGRPDGRKRHLRFGGAVAFHNTVESSPDRLAGTY
ncbi:MAG: hypothetical protein OXC72_01990 [Roseovarius sp.]|nr:hypothetical protein [Roseovarius sp.]